MTHMYVIGEDDLSCALGTRLVSDILGWSLALPAVNTKGVTKFRQALPRYANLARAHPVLCLADTDGKCASDLRTGWLPPHASKQFLLRFAVTESESWLLADHEALADFLGISPSLIPREPDGVADPKLEMLNLARRSRKRLIRQEVVSTLDTGKAGSGYNFHLCGFVRHHWNPHRATNRSPSLARAARRMTELGATS